MRLSLSARPRFRKMSLADCDSRRMIYAQRHSETGRSFSHAEWNYPNFTDPERIQRFVDKRRDIFADHVGDDRMGGLVQSGPDRCRSAGQAAAIADKTSTAFGAESVPGGGSQIGGHSQFSRRKNGAGLEEVQPVRVDGKVKVMFGTEEGLPELVAEMPDRFRAWISHCPAQATSSQAARDGTEVLDCNSVKIPAAMPLAGTGRDSGKEGQDGSAWTRREVKGDDSGEMGQGSGPTSSDKSSKASNSQTDGKDGPQTGTGRDGAAPSARQSWIDPNYVYPRLRTAAGGNDVPLVAEAVDGFEGSFVVQLRDEAGRPLTLCRLGEVAELLRVGATDPAVVLTVQPAAAPMADFKTILDSGGTVGMGDMPDEPGGEGCDQFRVEIRVCFLRVPPASNASQAGAKEPDGSAGILREWRYNISFIMDGQHVLGSPLEVISVPPSRDMLTGRCIRPGDSILTSPCRSLAALQS